MGKLPDGGLLPAAIHYMDYPQDAVFPIDACGFGAVMTSVDLLKRVKEKLGMPFSPAAGFGEDLSFCLRVKNVGSQCWCDSRVKVGHIGQRTITEEIYLSLKEEVDNAG
jgi:hypothetical protein